MRRERKESEEKEAEGGKETGQEKTTDGKPPGLEDVESELKTQGWKKPSQVKSEQEVLKEERRAQGAPEQRTAQEAREESARGTRAEEGAGGARAEERKSRGECKKSRGERRRRDKKMWRLEMSEKGR